MTTHDTIRNHLPGQPLPDENGVPVNGYIEHEIETSDFDTDGNILPFVRKPLEDPTQESYSSSDLKDAMTKRDDNLIASRLAIFGIKYAGPIVTTEPTIGRMTDALSLQDRATSLENAVKYLNQASRVAGMQKSVAFRESHASPEEAATVQRGAEVKLGLLHPGFKNAVHTLTNSEAMRQNGVELDKIELAVTSMQALLHAKLGIGKISALRRNRVVRTAQKTAKASK